MGKTLIIFTHSYPYGTGESFLGEEIRILKDRFNEIVILPLTINGTSKQNLYSNVSVEDDFIFDNIKYKRAIFINRTAIKWFFKLLIEDYKSFRKDYLKNFKSRLITIKWTIIRGILLKKWVENKNIENPIFYTYWARSWVYILSILKYDNAINWFISRAHGYDLYKERQKNGVIFLEQFYLDKARLIFLISKHGQDYLSSRYPSYTSKFKLSYLGTRDIGFNKYSKNGIINVLSISSLIPLKRVHLILQILSYLKTRVVWTHIGDGKLRNEILNASKSFPNNLTTNFLGQKSNQFVHKYLVENNITFFINVSITEGLPVSIMEVISCGIPVVATNVGGVSEIVNQETGLIIESNFNSKVIADKISNNLELFENKKFREGVRIFWEKNFTSSENYHQFFKEVSNL